MGKTQNGDFKLLQEQSVHWKPLDAEFLHDVRGLTPSSTVN